MEWIKKSMEYKEKCNVVRKDSNNDVSDNDIRVSENISTLPYIIENMLLSLLREIMDD